MLREPDSSIDQSARAVIGAAIEVHRHLGAGFPELVYQNAMAVELGRLGLAFDVEVPVSIAYKGVAVGQGRIDLLVGGCLVVEHKSVDTLLPIHVSQVLSYLKATALPLGLLINFNALRLRDGIKRVIHSSRGERI
jgi:GxxExxY protein